MKADPLRHAVATFLPRRLAATFALLGAAMSAASAAEPFAWRTATPESQGMSSAKLDSLAKDLATRGTKDFLVVRNDRIVYEWYAEGRSERDQHFTASLAKALVGGMSVAVALHDGRLKLDDPVSRYVSQWRSDDRKARITFRQLGSHTSGIEDAEADDLPHERLSGWKGDFWKRLDPPHDPFTISRDEAPLVFEPGSEMAYSNPGIAMLTYGVTAAIRDGEHKDVRRLLRERIMRPIGISDSEWSIGYGQTFDVDGLPLVAGWGGGSITPRAAARIGRLVLHEGDWDGARVLASDAVRQVAQDAGTPGPCGIGWWTNADNRYPDLPSDAVWGAGAQHQILLVVPSLGLIMVRNGRSLTTDYERDAVAHLLFDPLIAAITERHSGRPSGLKTSRQAPYPQSPIITGVEWAPAETIRRAAEGSDNWPLTWGDDDNLYTAYGDGRGFEPFVERKLSIGLAKILGGPDDFRGVNVRSADLEQPGDGARGKKASGLLMVDGILYLFARNAGNAQLAWSEDRGKSWTWADWKWTTSFGCPTFLNFSRNYAGARDGYVYVYSPDSDSAYEPADRMVLARVPKDRVRDRGAYEFFVSLDERGMPVWSGEIAQRGAVFIHPGRCYRGGITYNAPLKRYLWCHVLPESADPRGPRFQGGFGVYDAPEPWGPWTTAYFTNAWDVGPGESSSFPTKWMSDDGRTLSLVFSGDDHLSVRKAKLKASH